MSDIPNTIPFAPVHRRDVQVQMELRNKAQRSADAALREVQACEQRASLIARAVVGSAGFDPDVLTDGGWRLEINDAGDGITLTAPT